MTESNFPRDILGREIVPGDYIAHAGSYGRDPVLRIHRVVAIEPGRYPTLRVELVLGANEGPASKPGKKSQIHTSGSRSIIVTRDVVALLIGGGLDVGA